MKTEIKLSVVVPISRMAGKLELMFSWITYSTSDVVEIILIHDFQDVTTSDELGLFMSQITQSNLQLIEGEYNSPGLARNAGLERASGTWIQFVDSDDLPNIDASLSLIGVARDDSEILVGRFSYWDPLQNRNWKLITTGDEKIDLSLNPGIWRLIFKRENVIKNVFSHFRMGEDQLFLLENEIFNCQLEFSNLEIYRYTVGQSSQLTAQSWALRELERVIPRSINAYKDSKPHEMKYEAILITRQILTLTKHQWRSHQLSIGKLFSLGFKDLKLSYKLHIIKSLFLVLRYRNRYVDC